MLLKADPAIRRCFNMIEVVLALGVAGVGLVSILALFPIGFNASRDAAAENQASQAADQLLHQLQDLIQRNQPPFDWQTFIVNAGVGDNAYIASAYPNPAPPPAGAGDVAGNIVVQFDHTDTTFSSDPLTSGLDPSRRLYHYEYAGPVLGPPPPPPKTDGLYKAIAFLDRNANGRYDNGEPIEFEGLILVWRSQVQAANLAGVLVPIPYAYAARLNAEISWPAVAPYATRQRALYTLDLYNK